MDIVLSNKEMKAISKQALAELLDEIEKEKESQVSVRIDTGLRKLLDAKTKAFGFKNTSQTVRAILSLYFLPEVYKLEWKGTDFHKLMQEEKKYTTGRIRANYFLKSLVEYMSLLEQAKQSSTEVLSFIEGTEKEVNAIIDEMAGKMKNVIQEMESKQGAE